MNKDNVGADVSFGKLRTGSVGPNPSTSLGPGQDQGSGQVRADTEFRPYNIVPSPLPYALIFVVLYKKDFMQLPKERNEV